MRSRTPLVGWLLALAVVVSPALAQTMYKSTMPDGQVIYGDKPVPGAAKVESPKAPASKGITPSTKREAATLQQLEADRARQNAAEGQVRAAQQALNEAEANLAAGKEPLEGERIGTAKSGASRLTDAYWERQKALESAVEQARQQLESVKAGK
jgi:hypothetical protein